MSKPQVKEISGPSLAERIVAESFAVRDGALEIGGCRVNDLAEAYGTPLFAYDAELLRGNYRQLARALEGFAEVYYSVKANPHPSVAKIFVGEGAGLEIASAGEFERALLADCDPGRIIFAGPGKGRDELARTINAGIGEIHLETIEEARDVSAIAQELGRRVPVAVRVNPVAAVQGGAMRMGGKPTAFGFDEEDLEAVVAELNGLDGLDLRGVHLFAGTQILDAGVLAAQWRHWLDLAGRVADLTGRPLETIDLGGGLGVPYHEGDAHLDLAALRDALPALQSMKKNDPRIAGAHVLVEPGRFLTANAGVYLMCVRAVKMSRGQRFVVTDGGMHHHLAASGNLGQVIKRDYPIVAASRMEADDRAQANVVGPLCTPLDTLGRQTALPYLQEGDLVAVLQSGAYGLTASPTQFLSHARAHEVLVDRGRHCLLAPV